VTTRPGPPPYDRILSRQAVAVPVTDDGMLLTDAAAVAGADLMYLQVAPDLLLGPSRSEHGSGMGTSRPEVPLAAIRVNGATSPRSMPKSRPRCRRPGSDGPAANIYRVMGPTSAPARPKSPRRPGYPGRAGVAAGESAGAVFAREAFAAF